jgi:hypothetical protein
MKPFNDRQTTQFFFAFEADESKIWETLDGSEQDQVTNHLANLWIEHVAKQRETSADVSGDKSQSNNRSDSHE